MTRASVAPHTPPLRSAATRAGAVLLIGLTVLSGVVYGWMTNRWGVSDQLAEAGVALEKCPEQFGHWRLRSSQTLSEDALAMLESQGYVVRTYAHERTGQIVSLLLLVGPPGPTGGHTPEICFGGRGYTQSKERQPVTVTASDASKHQLWFTTFRSTELNAQTIRFYWAWSLGGQWIASENLRWTYRDKPYLYKIQVSTQVPAGGQSRADDAAREFLQEFLPVIAPLLIPVSDT